MNLHFPDESVTVAGSAEAITVRAVLRATEGVTDLAWRHVSAPAVVFSDPARPTPPRHLHGHDRALHGVQGQAHGHQEGRAVYLRFFILCLIGFLISPLSSAQYKRGRIGCSDFAEMEQYYKNDPDRPIYRLAYATCLITKGEDSKGLQMLYSLSDLRDEDATHINASYRIAEYLETGGTFKIKNLDKEKIEEAIKTYFKTLLYIKEFGQDYPPFTFKHVEFKQQLELRSV